jgi:hypothetical protein
MDELVELLLPEFASWLLGVWPNSANLYVRKACTRDGEQGAGRFGAGEEDIDRAIALRRCRGNKCPDPSTESGSFLSH